MFTDNLNPQQLKAVQHTEGPLLVVAGAGSGKTRVITCKIGYFITEKNVPPESILAITFTNKAAKEMKDRVRQTLGDHKGSPWVSTFHSFCLRVLRQHINTLGISGDFVIYDSQDQLSLLKQCMKIAQISEDAFSPKALLTHISSFKNDFQFPKDVDPETFSYGARMKAALLYPVYQDELKRNNGLDFDDLLLTTVRLLQEQESVRDYLSGRFRQILVDEFQDTNRVQYRLIQLLSKTHGNLCVVGDDDQSIYRWRGANIENILNFEKDFSGTTVIKLEENYRSTQNILKAAGAVVRENRMRKEKTLWTQNAEGDPIIYLRMEDEIEEARAVRKRMVELNREEGVSFNDMAVLYRTNAQSRVMEDELRKGDVPYQVVGGLRFYERREVKDILAYMRVVVNPTDSVSLRRIINVPTRGIGKTSLDKVIDHGQRNGITLMEALRQTESLRLTTSSAGKRISQFVAMMDYFQNLETSSSPLDLFEQIMERIGYVQMLEKEGTKENMKEGRARMENLQELQSALEQFVEQNPEGKLKDYLDTTALVADLDSLDDSRGLVPLMTLHTCKGLEFPYTFIIGMENGLLPHASSMGDPEEFEEERRLCYVGFTRAKKQLFLCNARRRRIYGSTFNYPPSDFIMAIPSEVLKKEGGVELPTYSKPTTPYILEPHQQKMPPTEFAATQEGYNIGTKVLHPKFGSGVIIQKEGNDDDLRVTVFFRKAGKKKLATNLANLIIV